MFQGKSCSHFRPFTNSLYRTTSRSFPAPATGRIAVKVINHYGDEVMKVLEVGGSQVAPNMST